LLSLVSLGPGFEEHLTPRAQKALTSSQVIVGYKMYVDLVRPLLSGQEVIATGMMGELQRCQLAIDRALAGSRVALISSGDVGVYGMAGLALEICQERGLRLGPLSGGPEVDLPLEVVPGVPALAAAAALLGAPLMHDFASVSLSDLMTPWEVIKKRVDAAAAADFVLVIYNPKSKKRDWQLAKVREILLHHRQPETPVGIVSRAMRAGQEVTVTNLGEMLKHPVDMQTIIIIGNSQTYQAGGHMITPRGYLAKYTLGDEKAEA
jgi:precorrin-3B C17-methyltransferase